MIQIIEGRKIYQDGEKELTVFDHLNLHIRKGEFLSIMGRSGSGKSTLLHILGCMDRLTSGEYRYDGKAIHNMKERELTLFRGKHFGFVFQSYFLIREFTVLQNVEAPMGYAGVPRKERREKAYRLLKMVGLEDKVSSYPDRLSGGQKQRVAIARALANDPDVIFADEPTGNLDRENGERIIEILTELHRQGTTILLVTHDEALGRLAESRYVLEDGTLRRIDSVS